MCRHYTELYRDVAGFYSPALGASHSLAPVACPGPQLPTRIQVTVPIVVHTCGSVCDRRELRIFGKNYTEQECAN